MMQSSALEKCSALVEEFVASCDLGDEDETVNDSVNRPIGLERRDSYRSDDGNSSSSVSSPTPTHHFADALVSRRANVPHSQRQRLVEVFQYPLREIDVVRRFLLLLRTSIDELLESLVVQSDVPLTSGAVAPPIAAVAVAASPTTTAAGVGQPTAEFLQLGHRNERLELLGRRIQLLFVDKLVPSITELEDMAALLRVDVQQNLNPFGFPSLAPDDCSETSSHPPAPAHQHHSHLPVEGPRDIDVVSASPLFSLLRVIAATPHDGVASATVASAITAFEGLRIGVEGGGVGLEGQLFHGQMQELRQLWKRLVGMLQEFGLMGRILRSAMASQRRHRQTWIHLLETGALDDLCVEVGEAARDDEDDAGYNSPASQLPDSLMRTATTRLQMRRLAMLVGTCRALDASGAEAAIKKIHFENERRQSAAFATTSGGTINGRRGTGAVVMLSSSAAAAFPMHSAVSQVFEESSARSLSPSAAIADDSVFAPDPFATMSSSMMPMQKQQSRRSLRRGSAVPPMQASASIVPPTTLMDLEMIVRAYGLTVPHLSLPEVLQQKAHQSAAPHPLAGTSTSTQASESPNRSPRPHLGGHDIEMLLEEKRRHRLAAQQSARRVLAGAAVADPSVASRQRVLYASNRADTAMMTTDCIVIQRCDAAAQTQTTGTVFEAATMDDVLGELNDARAALRERTQQLMLERHRSHALLSQLEKLQRQRQDHARRSAAAGSATMGGAAGEHEGHIHNHDEAPSPTRCLSPVGSTFSDGEDDIISPPIMNSSVDLLLLRFREQKERAALRRVPSAATTLERKKSAAQHNRATNAPGGNSPKRSPSPPLPRPHSSQATVPSTAMAGPVVKKFKIMGRLDKVDAHNHLRSESPPRHRSPGPALSEVPTAGSRHHPDVVPLRPEDLMAGHTSSSVGAGGSPGTAIAPAAAVQSPQSGTKLSRPGGSSLERQFGPIFARKLRSLEHHANGLVGTVQEEDYWTGKRDITAVVVPGGIDPRHGTRLVHKPGEGGGGAQHTMQLMQGPSAAALTRHALGSTQLKATHYGTVGSSGKK